MDEGDVRCYDDDEAGFVRASLVDWQAFYLYRDLARWRDLDAQQDASDDRLRHHDTPYWFPVGGTWDQLEQRLFRRWGSAPTRWWDRGPHLLPRYACLVCHDTGRVRQDPCPGCRAITPAPKQPRRREWVAMDQPQLFG